MPPDVVRWTLILRSEAAMLFVVFALPRRAPLANASTELSDDVEELVDEESRERCRPSLIRVRLLCLDSSGLLGPSMRFSSQPLFPSSTIAFSKSLAMGEPSRRASSTAVTWRKWALVSWATLWAVPRRVPAVRTLSPVSTRGMQIGWCR